MISPDSAVAFYFLAAVALLAAAASLYLLSRMQGLAARLRELETRLEQSTEYFQGLSAGAVGQGEHLVKMEQDLARMRVRLDQLAASGEGSGAGFNQAIRMARKGCSAREIMETCGLSQVEADLVVLLHKEGQR